jgi:hypothetical protein
MLKGLDLCVSLKSKTNVLYTMDMTQLSTLKSIQKEIKIVHKGMDMDLYGYELEFKDGCVILFACQEKKDIQAWMHSIEQAEAMLRERPISDWLRL